MSTVTPGICRHCGCRGEGHALPNGDECCWVDPSRTVCSAPGCVIAERARVQAERNKRGRSKYAGWGYGAILEDLRKQRRAGRRRKGSGKR